MTTSLPNWWDGLAEADRALFLEHRHADVVPSEVAHRLTESGQWIAGGKWADQSGRTFRWPGQLKAFLQDRAGDNATADEDEE
ncbi:hypothetical protein [Spirilliplanes yamanashiensis]|uniref:Uncharacterized protein n=1 Tax=Spirilliplanes yamanashiensis TaxID=42233 RepID=A0A8J3YEL1_9ACTN|nr:hypothetical protein [Spirilliplanes yamanashiensis]MDP9815228.1 hypothetical protein [Spirilliplanes yamanashiensis]GIJ06504.1 hypothetical protein Sya03_58560 [Spirilliplanes yamanashiensis]